MDRDRKEDGEDSDEEPTQYTAEVVSEEEEEVEEEEAEPDIVDSWPSFNERVGKHSRENQCDEHIRELDEHVVNISLRTREAKNNNPKSFVETKLQENPIYHRLETSDKRLDELIKLGQDLIANIRISHDRQEYDRRQAEKNHRNLLLAQLKAESDASNEKFDNIVEGWTKLNNINEAMPLWNQINTQKEGIAEIMKQKDEMIELCEGEIDRMHEQYELDQVRQAADLCCLIERVDNQITLLREAYQNHITLLENTIEDELQLFAMNATEKWTSYLQSVNENHQHNLNALKIREAFYAEETKRISEEQDEMTRSTRERLEHECDQLNLELQQMRSDILLNSERLDYNYQVLKKRNDENIIINNEQKRRVAKMCGELLHIRQKLKDAKDKARRTKNKLTSEIRLIHGKISDLEKKTNQLRITNKKKFDRVWEINYNEVISKVNTINAIDKQLYEQQLMLPWPEPDIDISDINFESKEAKLLKPSEQSHILDELPQETIRLLRNIVRKITDRGGFLIEERLLMILEPYMERNRCLVRLTNIFDALRVHGLYDIQQLAKVFEKYTFCPNCEKTYVPENSAVVLRGDGNTTQVETLDTPDDIKKSMQIKSKVSNTQIQQITPKKETKKCTNHNLFIEATLVLPAMNEFAANRNLNIVNPYDAGTHVNLIMLDEDAIRNFWRKFRGFIPDSKLNFWKKMEHCLNHYLDALKKRKDLHDEHEFLHRQNLELNHLLQRYTV